MGLETYLGKYANDDDAKKKFVKIMNEYAGGENLKEIGEFFKKIKDYDENLIPKILDDSKDYINRNVFVDYIDSIEHVYNVDPKLVGNAMDTIRKYKSNFREIKLIVNTIDGIEKPKELEKFLDIFGGINVEKISPIDLEEYVNFFKLFPLFVLIRTLKQAGVYINK